MAQQDSITVPLAGNKKQLLLQFPAQHQYLALLGTAVTAFTAEDALLTPHAYPLQLAIHEAVANIVDHGYETVPPGMVRVLLKLVETGQFIAEIWDAAAPFDPRLTTWPPPLSWRWEEKENGTFYTLQNVPEPDVEQYRGRGLFLMSQLLNEITCFARENGNYWQLVKELDA
jgi:anti-sigma regulatory factor (Ser/Thr protein kinase)